MSIDREVAVDAEMVEAQAFDELPAILQDRAHHLLDHGWSVVLMPNQPTDVRRRLEAEHPDSHRIMAVARPSSRPGRPTVWRGRNVRYFTKPAESTSWYRLDGAVNFIRYTDLLELDPDSAPFTEYDPASLPNPRTPRKRCDCAKRQFTEGRAAEALLDAQIKREMGGNTRRRERRTYQCEVDRRVWHLTSWETRHA